MSNMKVALHTTRIARSLSLPCRRAAWKLTRRGSGFCRFCSHGTGALCKRSLDILSNVLVNPPSLSSQFPNCRASTQHHIKPGAKESSGQVRCLKTLFGSVPHAFFTSHISEAIQAIERPQALTHWGHGRTPDPVLLRMPPLGSGQRTDGTLAVSRTALDAHLHLSSTSMRSLMRVAEQKKDRPGSLCRAGEWQFQCALQLCGGHECR